MSCSLDAWPLFTILLCHPSFLLDLWCYRCFRPRFSFSSNLSQYRRKSMAPTTSQGNGQDPRYTPAAHALTDLPVSNAGRVPNGTGVHRGPERLPPQQGGPASDAVGAPAGARQPGTQQPGTQQPGTQQPGTQQPGGPGGWQRLLLQELRQTPPLRFGLVQISKVQADCQQNPRDWASTKLCYLG